MDKHAQLSAGDAPWKLGDHPALDILNTVYRVDGKLVDSLQRDRDVSRWLDAFGWSIENDLANFRPASLLHAARTLREEIRALLEKRKAGKRLDPKILNTFLKEAQSYSELLSHKNGTISLTHQWRRSTPEQALAPLAESAADLLATADFNLVRRCEDQECVLWFYDRTKAHRRRWCSMTRCGNRHKVAAFRRRQQDI